VTLFEFMEKLYGFWS